MHFLFPSVHRLRIAPNFLSEFFLGHSAFFTQMLYKSSNRLHGDTVLLQKKFAIFFFHKSCTNNDLPVYAYSIDYFRVDFMPMYAYFSHHATRLDQNPMQ